MPSVNSAVQRCAQAYNQTFSIERGKGANGYESQKAARASFLNLIPDLDGHDAICDFIACVSYAMVHEILIEPHGTDLLGCARVALAAQRNRTKASQLKAA